MRNFAFFPPASFVPPARSDLTLFVVYINFSCSALSRQMVAIFMRFFSRKLASYAMIFALRMLTSNIWEDGAIKL